jgi:hypothetical protein
VATKFCTSCGGEFIASVDICPDCDIELVDERPEPVIESDAEGHIEYELHEWAMQSRAMLEQLLKAADIPRAWEGADLVVPASFEVRVDALVEQVEVSEQPTLDPDAPKVAYDIEDWTDARQTELMVALQERGVAYEFDADGALVVLEDNEATVEEVLDAIEFPDGDEGEGDADDDGVADGEDDDDDADEGDDEDYDGPEAMDVMSDLFVAADRLMHSATDAEAVLSLVERAEDASRMPLPYGFDKAVWKTITEQAAGLKAALEDDDSEDETIEDKARELRLALRSYV